MVGPSLRPGRALLPADLLVEFEPWRSHVGAASQAHWDPLVWDGVAQYYPWRLFAAESLQSGVLPLWNPYQFCGTPFIANGQSAVFYPLNLVSWVLPAARAFGWSAWLHLALTGWFAYLFLRRIGVNVFGSLAGAAVWQGNGFFAAWIHLPTVLCSASWLPLTLLLADQALTRGKILRGVAAGGALGLSCLAGHLQVFLLVCLFAAAWVLARGASKAAGARTWHRATRTALTGAVLAATAVGVASVQLLPSLELLRIAHRTFATGPGSYAAYLSHALPPLQAIGLILPHAFGHPALGNYVGRDNYAEFACYIGIAALGLALWGALAARRWHARFLALGAVCTSLVALGTALNWPLYRWVPGLARSGGPARILLLTVFSLSMLVGVGAEDILGRLSRGRAWAHAAIVVVLAALGAAALGWWVKGTPAVAEVEATVIVVAREETTRAALVVAGAIVALSLARIAALRRTVQPALIALLAADLVLASQHHVHIAPSAWVYPPIPISAPADGRVLGNARDWPINRFPVAVFPPNAATVYRLRDAFGYDSLYLARYRDFAAALQHGDPSPPLNGNLLLARLGPVYGLDMMSLVGVTTVLSPVPVRGLKMERAGAYYLLANPYARPRAWLSPSAVFRPSHAEAVVALATLGPAADCVIVTGPDDLGPLQPGSGAVAAIADPSPNEVVVKLSEDAGGYLFLADSYAPGWRAYAGGRELALRPADVAFRVAAVPRGASAVHFRYQPESFRVGLFVTLVALAALALVGGVAMGARSR